jgi:hypothetical protein
MSTNPLKNLEAHSRTVAPPDPQERQRFWIERGNRILWGQEPTSKGEWLTPRLDLEWFWNNGAYMVGPRR